MTKFLFIFCVTHQNKLHVSLKPGKQLECIWSIFFTYLLVSSVLLSCLCWSIAAFFDVLPPLLDQWNSVKPLAGMCIACSCECMCVDKLNWVPLVKNLLHSTTIGQKLHRVPLTSTLDLYVVLSKIAKGIVTAFLVYWYIWITNMSL